MEIKLNRKASIVAVDGTVILTKQNGAADILFIQHTKEGNEPEADVVAAIRYSTQAELEDLKKTLENALEGHKNAEK